MTSGVAAEERRTDTARMTTAMSNAAMRATSMCLIGALQCTSVSLHVPAADPIKGFWRVMKDAIGVGRCFGDLQQLYQRTRHMLMAHQERPIYAFHW